MAFGSLYFFRDTVFDLSKSYLPAQSIQSHISKDLPKRKGTPPLRNSPRVQPKLETPQVNLTLPSVLIKPVQTEAPKSVLPGRLIYIHILPHFFR